MIQPKIGLTKYTQVEVRAFFKKARALHKSPTVTVLVAPIELGAEPKLLIITSRHSGPAVERNTVRRRIKELYRQNKDRFSGVFLCFIIKRAVVSYQELSALFNILAKRCKTDQA